jgi:Amidase
LANLPAPTGKSTAKKFRQMLPGSETSLRLAAHDTDQLIDDQTLIQGIIVMNIASSVVTAGPQIKGTHPLHYLEATTLATQIRTKQLSSREVVQAHVDRTAAVNPKINAVVTLMAEDALKAADAADEAVANGATLGPLHGVPFSIKDALDTAGVLTQRGSNLFARNIPDKDARAPRKMATSVESCESDL